MMDETAIDWEVRVGLEADVAQLRRRDPEALAALLARYQNRLYRYLLRFVRDVALAEDLFQETWLRVVEKIDRYDARRSFEAWLFSLARHLAIDHLRRYRPESLDAPLLSGTSSVSERLPAAGPSALERVVVSEQARRLVEALDDLPAFYREVLALRFEEEMKLEEIAEVLEVPLSTVKTRLRRALQALRNKLEARSPEEEWQ